MRSNELSVTASPKFVEDTYRVEQDRYAVRNPCCKLSSEKSLVVVQFPLFPVGQVPAASGDRQRIPQGHKPCSEGLNPWAVHNRRNRQVRYPFAWAGDREEGMR